MRNWIKYKLRQWLGVEENTQSIKCLNELYGNLVSIGVDVHFKEPHMILIYSKLNGGQLRHIEASFDNLYQLNNFVKDLRERFRTDRETWDFPCGVSKEFKSGGR